MTNLTHIANKFLFKPFLFINFLLFASNSYSDNLKVITIDYAYYNPISLLMKDRKSLEKEFEKDKIKIRWVLSLGSNKALEYLNGAVLILDQLQAQLLLLEEQWYTYKSYICIFKTRMDSSCYK